MGIVIPHTRNQGRFYYVQHAPYRSVYDVYLNWKDYYYRGRGSRVAEVVKVSGNKHTAQWKATLPNDPLVEGFGQKRDAAVEDALQQVGEG